MISVGIDVSKGKVQYVFLKPYERLLVGFSILPIPKRILLNYLPCFSD